MAGTEACPYDLNARIFWADTGVRPYAFKFLDVGVTLSVVTRFRMCVDGSPTTIFAINFLDAVM